MMDMKRSLLAEDSVDNDEPARKKITLQNGTSAVEPTPCEAVVQNAAKVEASPTKLAGNTEHTHDCTLLSNVNKDVIIPPQVEVSNIETARSNEGKNIDLTSDKKDNGEESLVIADGDDSKFTSKVQCVKIPKRKAALLLSYCGAEYSGMQKNPDVDTIEERLMNALVAAEAIQPDHRDRFLHGNENQMQYTSASRTDKGVSAAQQVVALKLRLDRPDFLDSINAHLPSSIRVLGFRRVTQGFNAKTLCSGREYEYLTPSISFAADRKEYSASYRLDNEQVARANAVLKLMTGTHNFHNFTSGKLFNDKSATRYVTKFELTEPFVKDGEEFVSVLVAGQSFMIHQIRKMIGLCSAICRGWCTEEVIEKCWLPDKVDIPRAPGLGLLLNKVHFTAYDARYASSHCPLTWTPELAVIEEFKREQIFSTILREELDNALMMAWLKTLRNHSYNENVNRPIPLPDVDVDVTPELTADECVDNATLV